MDVIGAYKIRVHLFVFWFCLSILGEVVVSVNLALFPIFIFLCLVSIVFLHLHLWTPCIYTIFPGLAAVFLTTIFILFLTAILIMFLTTIFILFINSMFPTVVDSMFPTVVNTMSLAPAGIFIEASGIRVAICHLIRIL